MKWFYNLRIAAKLLMCFVFIALIAAFIGYSGYSAMQKMNADKNEITTNRLPSIQSLLIVSRALSDVQIGERGLVIDKLMDGDTRKAQYDYIDNALKQADEAWKIYEPLPQTPEEADDWKTFVTQWDQWIKDNQVVVDSSTERDKLIASGISKDDAKVKAIDNQTEDAILVARNSFLVTHDTLEKIIVINEDQAKLADTQSNAAYASASRTLLITIIIGVLAAIGLGIFLTGVISNPVNKLAAAADKLALGNVNVTVEADTKDEIGNMMRSFSKIIEIIKERADVTRKISDGDMTATVKVKSEEDVLGKNLGNMLDTLKALIKETNALIEAGIAGKLEVRGNTGAFVGSWSEIIGGFNKTLDAVVEPVKEASEVLREMSKGNLDTGVKGDYKGDHAEIKNSLNDTIKTLNNVLGDINSASEQVAAGARQVSDSSQALSQGSTEQAGSIQQVTASVNEVAEQTKQNAISANQANQLALTAKENAITGNSQMQEMLKAMVEINESSTNISKIIKVIDEIAFQTNILALNAAVEAARAGQHGKGFAVVAEEVRNLAARSANAARETTALIEGSIKKVEVGTAITSETAKALNKIVGDIAKVTELVGNIATASNEQANGISQINDAIAQVSVVIQNNSATAEEGAAASEELSGQSEILRDMVSKFKLRRGNDSIRNLEGLNPEVIKILEGISRTAENKKNPGVNGFGDGRRMAENASTASRVKISLNDMDFGKY